MSPSNPTQMSIHLFEEDLGAGAVVPAALELFGDLGGRVGAGFFGVFVERGAVFLVVESPDVTGAVGAGFGSGSGAFLDGHQLCLSGGAGGVVRAAGAPGFSWLGATAR